MIITLMIEMEIAGERHPIGTKLNVSKEIARIHSNAVLEQRKKMIKDLSVIKEMAGEK